MKNFNVPTRNEVTPNKQALFDNLEKAVGFLPNLYATYPHNDTALSDYLALANRKTSLSAQEKEIVNLVVSQVNDSASCLAAHTAIGIINGFTNRQILEIRSGRASFNSTLYSLAQYVKNAPENRSKPSSESIANLFSAGYTKAEVIDIVMLIGDKTISNYLHGTTQVPVDFLAAAAL